MLTGAPLDASDTAAVFDVLTRYAVGIDTRDWVLFRTCWTDDCTCDYGEIGSWDGGDAITAFMAEVHEPCGTTMHRLTDLFARRDGDVVNARTCVDAIITFGDQAHRAIGVYVDRLVPVEGSWRIAARRFEGHFSRFGPIEDVVF
jgi:hypothetical protein